jgi:hypothetical protein
MTRQATMPSSKAWLCLADEQHNWRLSFMARIGHKRYVVSYVLRARTSYIEDDGALCLSRERACRCNSSGGQIDLLVTILRQQLKNSVRCMPSNYLEFESVKIIKWEKNVLFFFSQFFRNFFNHISVSVNSSAGQIVVLKTILRQQLKNSVRCMTF